jgi:hypothetical protein
MDEYHNDKSLRFEYHNDKSLRFEYHNDKSLRFEYRNDKSLRFEYRNDKSVRFASTNTYYYCSAEIIDELAQMDLIIMTQQISNVLIDEMCVLLEQFHLS